jgi:hypothetical protein
LGHKNELLKHVTDAFYAISSCEIKKLPWSDPSPYLFDLIKQLQTELNQRVLELKENFDSPMSIAEILIWESTNLLLLIPMVLGLVIATWWWKGQPVFTDRDWRFLFGHPREKVFTEWLWLRFSRALAVVSVGVIIVLWVLPFGLWWFAGAVLFAIVSVCSSPKWLR